MLIALTTALTNKFATQKTDTIIHDSIEVSVIFLMVIGNSVFEASSVLKAQRSIDALTKITKAKCLVIRNGIKQKINTEEVVLGDVIVISRGEIVPADAVLLQGNDLIVNESILTGESVEQVKSPHNGEDHKNQIFMGTNVVNGHCWARVTATGNDSALGVVNKHLQEAKAPASPLDRKINQLTGIVIFISFLVAIAVFIIILTTSNNLWSESLLIGTVIAISIIPESLPLLISFLLSLATKKMAKRKIIVKKLKALEGLGSTNVICTDKTGTLTQNTMSLEKIIYPHHVIKGSDFKYDPNNLNHRMLMNTLICCNNAVIEKHHTEGSQTELGLLRFAQRFCSVPKVREKWTRIKERSFNSVTKMMSTDHQDSSFEGVVTFIKGAPENILATCQKYLRPDGQEVDFDQDYRACLDQHLNLLASLGVRILACAYKNSNHQASVFLAAVGLMDPLHENASQAIALCKQAGVGIKMLTGDSALTGLAIAKKLAIAESLKDIITGHELEKLQKDQPEALAKIVNAKSVFARLTPVDKKIIVTALQKEDKVVAMTGDGVNDGPSLKQADIGVAVGASTPIAKEAADMVLSRNNFHDLVSLIATGRNIFLKIQRIILFVLAANLSGAIALLLLTIIYKNYPAGPINVLWFNILIEHILALSYSASSDNDQVLKWKPRSIKANILKELVFPIMSSAIITACVIILAFYLGYNNPTLTNSSSRLASGRTLFMIVWVNAPIIFFPFLKLTKEIIAKINIIFSKAMLSSMLLAFSVNTIFCFTPYLNSEIFLINNFINGWTIGVAIGLAFLPAVLIFSSQLVAYYAMQAYVKFFN